MSRAHSRQGSRALGSTSCYLSKTDRWEDQQSGQKRSRVKIVAEVVRFLGRGNGGPSAQPADEPAEISV